MSLVLGISVVSVICVAGVWLVHVVFEPQVGRGEVLRKQVLPAKAESVALRRPRPIGSIKYCRGAPGKWNCNWHSKNTEAQMFE